MTHKIQRFTLPALLFGTLLLACLTLAGCQPDYEYTDASIYSLLANPQEYSAKKVGVHGFLIRDYRDRWKLHPNKELAAYDHLENSIFIGLAAIKEECNGDFVYAIVTLKPFRGINLETAEIQTLGSYDRPVPHLGCLTSDIPPSNESD